ncbi:uncharacterized protein CTRU02_204035 [Colletotrichum truncatum]|uniref:Uncharacterized protein n=1 Tax=Colletotrichum truncatum TaxID=5467 RepID=A0ACC3ZBI9_COLTU|nr:uncharacterized protein CTRU02_13628 [Colletotrichum truncatum]KAF6783161.1 hypothetical protein CTRU02_13628 [Colletotrichum truncatum]
MSTFHPFPRLPLELRQHIWELSMEPREVPAGKLYPTSISRPPRIPPPSVLQACVESRLYLQSYYKKAFVSEKAPNYTWVNFDIDTVYITQNTMEDMEEERPLIRWLIVESSDEEIFTFDHAPYLFHMPALETVTILHRVPFGMVHKTWWYAYHHLMLEFYFYREPVRFYTKVICAEDPQREINKDNYFQLACDMIREEFEGRSGTNESDYQISGGGDEV